MSKQKTVYQDRKGGHREYFTTPKDVSHIPNVKIVAVYLNGQVVEGDANA